MIRGQIFIIGVQSGIRRILFSLLSVVLIISCARTADGKSIIVKFRSSETFINPSLPLQKTISSVSPITINSAKTFSKIRGGQIPQNTEEDFGLSRTILLPLKQEVSVESAVSVLQALGEIEYAEPNYIFHIDAAERPNDSLYGEQWAHSNMHVAEAWQITKGDSTVKIGFVDTGVDWLHPDLVGQFAVNPVEDINHNGLFDAWPSTEKRKDAYGNLVTGDLDGIDNDGNGFTDDVIGYDFVDQEVANYGDASVRDPIPFDENMHGTAVAGVIGAKENNRIGVAGIAPHTRMVVLRAFDATGNAEDDDIASAIIYAADNAVRILNLSFGDIVPSLLQRDAIRYATSKGVLVFASSGNRGGDGHHYPSDFDECVSVGATNNIPNPDVLYSFTTHGEGMDMVAPGGNIYTCALDAEYQLVNGTSFSSPAAAAVAALVLSAHPTVTATELRSILASTTYDISPKGFDHETANGRVDALAAVSFGGSTAIKILSPHTNDGFHPGDKVAIIGSAAHALFTGYTLSYAAGQNPGADKNTVWKEITSSDKQVIQDTLGVLDAKDLSAGTYTLRLALSTSDGRSVEERMNIDILSRVPKLVFLNIDTVFINESRGLLIRAKTDTLTTASVYFKASSSSQWKAQNDDRFTKEHYWLLSKKEIQLGVQIDVSVVLRNAAGDSISSSFSLAVPNEAIAQTGFSQKTYSLPLGFALDSVLMTPKGDEVTMSIFPPAADFGPIGIYSFDGISKLFVMNDSLSRNWVPRTIGNTSGDSKPELLLQGGNNYLLYKQNAAHSLLGELVLYDTTENGSFFAMGLGDVDGDGKDEIITKERIDVSGRLADVIRVRKRAGNTTNLFATLSNTTPPGPQYQDNNYNKPDVRFADVDGDGIKDIILIDDDADLLVYKYDPSDPTKFRIIFKDENDGETEGNLVTTGDFNGDGKKDIAYAFHTPYLENSDREYQFPFWTLKILFGSGNGNFTTNTVEHFANARSLSPYRSSLGGMKNVTGKPIDDLGLSFFPNFYLYEYDPQSGKMRPVWNFPAAVAPRTGLCFDFDRNGKNEFALNAPDSIRFFERDDAFSSRTMSAGGFEAIPRDTDRVDLHWGDVAGATLYYILRAPDINGANYDVIDSTTASKYVDTTVLNDSTYIYSVVAIDQTKPVPLSLPAYGVSAFVHPKPVIIAVNSDGRTVIARTSQPLSKSALAGGMITVNDTLHIETTALAGDSTFLLTLNEELPYDGEYQLKVNSDAVRDKWNSPIDTTPAIWHFSRPTAEKYFYIVKWRFTESHLAHVTFNLEPADNALDISHYSMTPYGNLVKAYRDTLDPYSIYIELDKNFDFTANGLPYLLCAKGITSQEKIPLDVEADCIGVTLTEPNLDKVFVYPNPIHSSDEKVTFGGLTSQAEISIYSLNQRFLRKIQTTEHKGGAEWDIRDDIGRPLPSGIYLYRVTGKDDNGTEVEAKESKFVIINDK
jgi:subtilisin family serine protease